MEAFHVIHTHPQILVGIGDENSQYDAWGNFSRAITPNATPSPHLAFEPTEQEMFDSVTMRYLDEPAASAKCRAGHDGARDDGGRRAHGACSRSSATTRRSPTPCVSDSIYYTLFPNFHPWGGYNRIVYRFRPYQNRFDKSIMECYYLSPFAGERPPPAKIHWLEEEQPWTEAPELGMLAKVFTQDTFNLPQVQTGLRGGAVRRRRARELSGNEDPPLPSSAEELPLTGTSQDAARRSRLCASALSRQSLFSAKICNSPNSPSSRESLLTASRASAFARKRASSRNCP